MIATTRVEIMNTAQSFLMKMKTIAYAMKATVGKTMLAKALTLFHVSSFDMVRCYYTANLKKNIQINKNKETN